MNMKNTKALESFFYVSNDFGLTFSKFETIIDGNPVFVTDIHSIKNYAFCFSEINSSFFYFGSDLKILHYLTFIGNSQIHAHTTFSNIVVKFVTSNDKSVSF
ncbi:hypothetical protein RF11_02829 [Thelohanellus kitauei]|uniref:Sortilin N-terminal domain-containing protein n=1 Tax=Thelohanellus kitauei TaxID=669202 RepID=A0A0C2M8X3_THEKT|nr:hypothetical protein RF11_02829 [Thelohanellus kitauei]